jgi:hypothetical protein
VRRALVLDGADEVIFVVDRPVLRHPLLKRRRLHGRVDGAAHVGVERVEDLHDDALASSSTVSARLLALRRTW